MSQVDKLFEQNQVGFGEFVFDEQVAAVFDDMILRSVPLYRDVQAAIPRLVNLLEHDPLKVVDLGCSTGTSLIQLATKCSQRKLQLIGVDNSPAMLARCREYANRLAQGRNIQLVEADIGEFRFEDASAVLMNYTLQFIPLDSRLRLLTRIRQSIRPGGFFLLSEKFCHPNPVIQNQWIELYFDYKRQNGYSELEIARKRDALENVLVPVSLDENLQLLRDAGFQDIEVLLKWFNFGSILARV